MNAVSYSRVSTDEQAREGFSLEVQDEKTRQYIQMQEWNLVGVLSDPGFSGKDLNRPAMKRLLTEIKEKRVNAVVVHKLDRLTRSIGDLNDLVNLFQKYNVKFVSISENIDTSTAVGRMFLFMLGIFAQWYRENLGEEVRKGMVKRAEKGLKVVSVPMYGYTFDENYDLVIKEEEAKWIRWIFDRYLQGIGTTNIAKELNDQGIFRNQGGRWDQSKVMRSLRNPYYMGMVHYQTEMMTDDERIIALGIHEPIITKEAFDMVQRIIERRSAGLISRNSYSYIFGGIIRCGTCGGTYKGKYNKRTNGELYRGYVCSNNERYRTCSQSGISELRLTKLLFDNIDKLQELENRFDKSFSEVAAAGDDEIEDVKKQIIQSEARRRRWQMAYGDGFMPYEDFSERMKEEMDKVAVWEQQIAKAPKTVASTMPPNEARGLLTALKENWQFLEQDTKKQLIQSLIQQVTIKKDDEVWHILNMVTT